MSLILVWKDILFGNRVAFLLLLNIKKTFLNAISICKAQDVWNSNTNSYNFFADSFSSYCKPLLKALAKLEPDSAKEIKKQFEWFVGEI